MILLAAPAEPAGNPRFSATDKEVGYGNFALKQLDKLKAPEERKFACGKSLNAASP